MLWTYIFVVVVANIKGLFYIVEKIKIWKKNSMLFCFCTIWLFNYKKSKSINIFSKNKVYFYFKKKKKEVISVVVINAL